MGAAGPWARPGLRAGWALTLALALALALALLSGATVAAAARPPAADFFGPAEMRWAGLSPDGRQLAMTRSLDGGRVGLFVMDLSPGGATRRLASYANADIVQARWVGDTHLVFGVQDFQRGSARDSIARPGLFSVDATGGPARVLVARAGPMGTGLGSSGGAPLTHNHVVLGVPAGARDELIIGEQVLGGRKDLDHIEPAWLNVVTGRKRDLALGERPAHALRWWFDPRGQARAVLTQQADRQTVWWRAPGGSAWQVLAEAGTADLPFQPAAVDAQGQLYVTHRVGPAGLLRLSRLDMSTREPTGEPLLAPAGFDVDFHALFDAEGAHLIGLRNEAERETTRWLDPTRQALQQLVDAQWPDRVNRIHCRRCDRPDAVVLVQAQSDREPGAWTLLRRAQAADGSALWRPEPLGYARPAITPSEMAGVELHRIRTRDGRELPVWLTRPAAAAGEGPRPAVVLVHGGPWVRGNFWQWEPWAQFLASRGHLVISPEFRGSAGYGRSHLDAGDRQWGAAMQDDLADALHWAQAQGWARAPAAIAGASYGGYATLMGLARDPELYRCGVAWVAPSDLLLYAQGSWWVDDDISDLGRAFILKNRVGDPDRDREALVAASPLTRATQIRAPLLRGYGEADRRVPLLHGQRLREAMTAAGHAPQWVSYPDEGHSWRLAATRIDFAERMERFLAACLNPAP